ncbi:AraC family transcriptional regulator [Pseudomonas helleri]|uniref:AraC family transcriptional regulator n=1 Tax=Pseudomonas helleri TaxID=1608996 RepID=UPI0037FB495D
MPPKIHVFWKQKVFAPYKIAALIRTVAEQGITSDVVLQGIQLDASHINDPNTLTSIRQYINACDNVIAAAADVSSAFQMGQHLHLSAYGVYGHGLMCSSTVRDFFNFAVKYQALSTPALRFHWREEVDVAAWIFFDTYGHLISQGAREFLIRQQMAQQMVHLMDTAGGECRPIKALFAFPDAGNKAVYEQFLGCECVFDCPASELHYPQSILSQVPQFANRITHGSLQEACDRLMRQTKAHAGVTGEVHQMLILTPGQFPTMEQIALQMQITTRTLRRKLEAEGTDYGTILDGVRGTLALEYLQTTRMSTEDIAIKIGFSDGSNFRRAFKRWTGKTTRQMRYAGL